MPNLQICEKCELAGRDKEIGKEGTSELKIWISQNCFHRMVCMAKEGIDAWILTNQKSSRRCPYLLEHMLTEVQ